jgi:hypothetical protein
VQTNDNGIIILKLFFHNVAVWWLHKFVVQHDILYVKPNDVYEPAVQDDAHEVVVIPDKLEVLK